jgi:hypothetical protein
VVNTILAKRVNHIVAKGDIPVWPKGSKSRGFSMKEDFWISCYMKYKERKVLTDLRYNFEQKNTFVNAGGLASIRNQEEERKSILFIKKNFGDSILLKSATTNGKDKTKQLVQYNISCKFKF